MATIEDIGGVPLPKPGKRFGELEVEGTQAYLVTNKRKALHILCICLACNSTYWAYARKLVRGAYTSCGCKTSEVATDLTGTMVGALLVTKCYSTSARGPYAYDCQCTLCDRKYKRMAKYLRVLKKGGDTGCRCINMRTLQKRRQIQLGVQLPGTQLTPVKATDRHLSSFECKCTCGSTKVILHQNLASGSTKSCGCLLKSKVKRLRIFNQEMTYYEAAEAFGVNFDTVRHRIDRMRMTPEEALLSP